MGTSPAQTEPTPAGLRPEGPAFVKTTVLSCTDRSGDLRLIVLDDADSAGPDDSDTGPNLTLRFGRCHEEASCQDTHPDIS
jgi:hypothetical protein